ncbi:MAG: sigma factor G inhibitor Gin [Sarcina sp.]
MEDGVKEIVKVTEMENACIICGNEEQRGIVILGKKICLECEEKAIKADINSDFYESYRQKIFTNVVGKLKKLG